MTEKHAAEVLADQLTEDHAWAAEELKTYIGSMVGAAEMLRTIPALEAERDALRAEVLQWQRQFANQSEVTDQFRSKAEALRAEVESLRADAERYRWVRFADGLLLDRMAEESETAEDFDAAIDAARKS